MKEWILIVLIFLTLLFVISAYLYLNIDSGEGNMPGPGPSPGPSLSPSQSTSPGPSPGPSQNGEIMDCSVLDQINESTYILDDSGSPICFNTQYAEEILNTSGLVRKTDTNILSKVTAEDLWNTVTNQYNQTPTGKRISYISDDSISYEDMVNSGCIRYELEDCEASKEPSNCAYYEKTIKDCYADKCGEKLKKQVQYVKERPEFGEGSCDVDFSVRTEECDESEPPCCDINDLTHWVKSSCNKTTGFYNMTTTSCSNKGQDVPIKTSEDACIVDCEGYHKPYENIGDEICTGDDNTRGELQQKQISYWVTTTEPRNGGEQCPASIEDIAVMGECGGPEFISNVSRVFVSSAHGSETPYCFFDYIGSDSITYTGSASMGVYGQMTFDPPVEVIKVSTYLKSVNGSDSYIHVDFYDKDNNKIRTVSAEKYDFRKLANLQIYEYSTDKPGREDMKFKKRL